MKKTLICLLLAVALLAVGCDKAPESRPADVEPTATYGWMAGESPVPVKRIGVNRYGLNLDENAVSPDGCYFLDDLSLEGHDYILYSDNGSDTMVKLCGRADCTHNNTDCNAYLYKGAALSFYHGYLYAVSGASDETKCELIRMEPDGSDHTVILDILGSLEDIDVDYVSDVFLNDGVLFFDVFSWRSNGTDDGLSGKDLGTWYYKLDGSMEKPEEASHEVMYSCGEVFLCYHPLEVQHGGEYGSFWSWYPETNTYAYLTDHPGQPGYFDEDEGYFFRDGAIWRKTYEDNQEQVMVETGLEGKYILSAFPDCIVLLSREDGTAIDRNLYVYNWAFEPVDKVKLDYSFDCRPEFLLIGETAERLILASRERGLPTYFINKSELGTGNAELHRFMW